jgi:hypothetical protein
MEGPFSSLSFQQPNGPSRIWMLLRGRPLTSHEVIVQTIAATTAPTGLTVQAGLDDTLYPKGIKISDVDLETLETTAILTRDDFHGEWNCTLHPQPSDTPDPNQVN